MGDYWLKFSFSEFFLFAFAMNSFKPISFGSPMAFAD